MVAFATHQDLATRMMRTFTVPEQEWVTALLDDAADLMRGVMRNQVYPATTSTYIAYPTGGRVALPQSFVRSIESVQRDGIDVAFTRFQDVINVGSSEPVEITFTYGLDAAPSYLIQINCALVSAVMLTVEAGVGLTAGGLSSIAIDDFKAAWADAGASAGMVITEHVRRYLEETYGVTAWVVEGSQ